MKGEVERLGKKSNELWTGVGMMKARKKEMEQLEWAVADEQGFNQIIEVTFFFSLSLFFSPPSTSSLPPLASFSMGTKTERADYEKVSVGCVID
jgi:hypothetical protein